MCQKVKTFGVNGTTVLLLVSMREWTEYLVQTVPQCSQSH